MGFPTEHPVAKASHTQDPSGTALEPSTFRFGPFRLDVFARHLSRDGEPLPVSSKAFDILTVLVRRAGQVVTKAELMDLVWPGVFVDEVNLAQHVSALRKLLGDSTKHPSFIATIPRQGYQFIARVSEAASAADTFAPAPARGGRTWIAMTMLGLCAVAASLIFWVSSVGRAESKAAGTDSIEAFEAYARGRFLIRQGSKEGLLPALTEFTDAVALDPGFARAHAELANTYVSLFLVGEVSYSEAISNAQAAASTALELQPDLADAHLAQGAVYLQLGSGFDEAEPYLREAVALDPANDLAYDLLARALRHEGRLDESIEAARQALALKPESVRYHALLARSMLFAERDFEEARELCRVALTLDRSSTNVLELLADIEETDGRPDAAVAAWAELERQRGAGDLADELERDRDAVGAEEALVRYREARLARLDADDPSDGFERGRILERLGRRDEAFEAFEHASANAFTIGVYGLGRHPAYRALAADPRFAEFERRVTARLVPGLESK